MKNQAPAWLYKRQRAEPAVSHGGSSEAGPGEAGCLPVLPTSGSRRGPEGWQGRSGCADAAAEVEATARVAK